MEPVVQIIGAGLAGCEAAWQLIKRGVKVRLYEMKPQKFSPAHKTLPCLAPKLRRLGRTGMFQFFAFGRCGTQRRWSDA